MGVCKNLKGDITFRELALRLDALQRPLEAAWAYEIALTSPDADLDLFLNLAVLYFECQDFGFASNHKLSQEFTSGCWIRLFESLAIAEERFGKTTEIDFWRLYALSIYSDDEGIESQCIELLDRNDSLLPAMYLFFLGHYRFIDQMHNLLKVVERGSTQRERYIKSVVESALRKYKSEAG